MEEGIDVLLARRHLMRIVDFLITVYRTPTGRLPQFQLVFAERGWTSGAYANAQCCEVFKMGNDIITTPGGRMEVVLSSLAGLSDLTPIIFLFAESVRAYLDRIFLGTHNTPLKAYKSTSSIIGAMILPSTDVGMIPLHTRSRIFRAFMERALDHMVCEHARKLQEERDDNYEYDVDVQEAEADIECINDPETKSDFHQALRDRPNSFGIQIT